MGTCSRSQKFAREAAEGSFRGNTLNCGALEIRVVRASRKALEVSFIILITARLAPCVGHVVHL